MSLPESFASFIDRLRHINWEKAERRIRRLFYHQGEERLYVMSSEKAATMPAYPEANRDRWEDLATYVPDEPGILKSAKLEEWRRRLDRGEHVYTRMSGDHLAAFGWLIERQKISRLEELKQEVELPDECAVLYDFYCLKKYRNSNFYQRLLMHSLQDAARVPGTRWIHLGVSGYNKVPQWWMRKLGMEYRGSCFYRRVLWSEKIWREPA